MFRTFSKAYGLAGVRVGYAVSHPSVADMLNRVRQAFNVSVVGLAGAAAALDDPAHVAAAVKVAVAERARVAARLAAVGHARGAVGGQLPAAARRCRMRRQRFDALLRQGIIVRPVGNYELPEHLRVTLGTRRAERSFPERLGSLLASR